MGWSEFEMAPKFASRSHRQPIKHHRALLYPQMLAFYDKLLQVGKMPSQALCFTVLTAARTSEVLGARTEEFDLGKLIWRVPAERVKAGNHMTCHY